MLKWKMENFLKLFLDNNPLTVDTDTYVLVDTFTNYFWSLFFNISDPSKFRRVVQIIFGRLMSLFKVSDDSDQYKVFFFELFFILFLMLTKFLILIVLNFLIIVCTKSLGINSCLKITPCDTLNLSKVTIVLLISLWSL